MTNQYLKSTKKKCNKSNREKKSYKKHKKKNHCNPSLCVYSPLELIK